MKRLKLSISDQREGGVYNNKFFAKVSIKSISDQREGGVYNLPPSGTQKYCSISDQREGGVYNTVGAPAIEP